MDRKLIGWFLWPLLCEDILILFQRLVRSWASDPMCTICLKDEFVPKLKLKITRFVVSNKKRSVCSVLGVIMFCRNTWPTGLARVSKSENHSDLVYCSVDYLSATVRFCVHYNYAIYYSNFSSFLRRRDSVDGDRYYIVIKYCFLEASFMKTCAFTMK